MAKVLLVLENYSELAYCETILKKVGIDVEGCQNDLSVSELVMTFLPDLVVASAQGRKVNGVRIAGKLLHAPHPAFLVLLASDVNSVSAEDRLQFNISAVLSNPIDPQGFLTTIAGLLNLDLHLLLKKLSRTFDTQPAQTNTWVKSGENSGANFQRPDQRADQPRGDQKSERLVVSEKIRPSSVTDKINPSVDKFRAPRVGEAEEKRRARYAAGTQDLPEATQNGLKREIVVDQIRDFRKTGDDPEINSIDRERQLFTQRLFERDQEERAQLDRANKFKSGGEKKK